MAPLPPSSTVRYFLDYEGVMGKHTMQFRAEQGFTDAQVITGITNFLNPLLSIIHQSVVFNSLRKAAAGSNISNPVTWSLITGNSATALTPPNYPRFISFIGRSFNNRRCRIYLYGTTVTITDDYRLNFSESSAVQAAVDFLNSAAAPFAAIDGFHPVWKAYANQGYNSYHERKRRAVA
jgi:hypothetical protein